MLKLTKAKERGRFNSSPIIVSTIIIIVTIVFLLTSEQSFDLSKYIAIIVSVVAVYVSLQQYNLQKSEHKFKLFDKRMEIYSLLKLLMFTVKARAGKYDLLAFRDDFEHINSGKFLFPISAREFFNEFKEHSLELIFTAENLEVAINQKNKKEIKKLTDKRNILVSIIELMYDHIDDIFDKYLSIKE